MITRKEYDKAVLLVNNYKQQIKEEYENLEAEYIPSYTDITPIFECKLSVRIYNIVKSMAYYRQNKMGILCVGDLSNVTRHEWESHRNVGKKSMEEIDKLYFHACKTMKI